MYIHMYIHTCVCIYIITLERKEVMNLREHKGIRRREGENDVFKISKIILKLL